MTRVNPSFGEKASKYPELVFGLVAALGTDLDLLSRKLSDGLKIAGYKSHLVHLIKKVPGYAQVEREADIYNKIKKKIELGTNYRQQIQRSDAFARIAVEGIQGVRSQKNSKQLHNENQRKGKPLARTAYVIRQLKTPAEVDALRDTYGHGVYAISAYSSLEARLRYLANLEGSTRATGNEQKAKELIGIDEMEEGKGEFGQQIRSTFPKADFFVNMDASETNVSSSINRLVELIFGVTHAPTVEEYGMFHASTAALRSRDLSRQVGAAIGTSDGDVISVGTNEVPRPFGGTLREEDNIGKTDYEMGYHGSQRAKKHLLKDVVANLVRKELIRVLDSDWENKVDIKALLLDRVDLSRIVHAEMAAITTAAKLGVSIKGCILYTTTFPCHDCTKHIIASGMTDIVYVEPYAKSFTSDFYPDSIDFEGKSAGKVQCRHFIGTSPLRYTDFFRMEHPFSRIRRMDKGGIAMKPTSSSWDWRPRFGVDPIGTYRRECLLIDSFS